MPDYDHEIETPRTRKELRQGQELDKFRLAEPATALDQLAL